MLVQIEDVDYEYELYKEQMYNSMRTADTISFPYTLMSNISKDISIANRTYAIEWMKKVSYRVVTTICLSLCVVN